MNKPSAATTAEPAVSAPAVSAAEQRFEDIRRRAGLFIAPLAALAIYILAGGLTPECRRLSAILVFVAALWVTEAIPIPIASLTGAMLAVIFAVTDAKTAFAPFADPIVFLFIGSFILTQAMMQHRLDRRFALAVLSLPVIGGSPLGLLIGLGLVTATLSMLVSNTATAAMMMPIAIGILATLSDLRKAHSPVGQGFATGMLLMVAYAASIGGIVTPVGSPPNLICIGLLKKLAGTQISFVQWICLCLPIFFAMFAALVTVLYLLHPPKRSQPAPGELSSSGLLDSSTPGLLEYIRAQRQQLGPWTAGQINTLIAFAVAIVLWVGPGVLAAFVDKEHPLLAFCSARLPEAVAALLAASLLFILPTDWKQHQFTLTWKQAAEIDWGTILLFGGGLSLGGLMFTTGLADTLGRSVMGLLGVKSLWMLTATATLLGILLTEVTSNTAAANMIIPVVIALSKEAGVSPLPPALGACLGASFAFMLPISTPPNAIAYSTGKIPITKMIRAGIIYDAVGFVIILAGLRLLCPLLGLM
ncbi:MAG TPA: DASS family sodium-coupled anion symporter [Planctomycetota bacterium]